MPVVSCLDMYVVHAGHVLGVDEQAQGLSDAHGLRDVHGLGVTANLKPRVVNCEPFLSHA